MRIIKLSKQEFSSSAEVLDFFETVLFSRSNPGKFRVTAGRINANYFRLGEMLVFSYLTTICYISRSASPLKSNTDRYRKEYPHFFVIDMDSIRRVEMASLYDIEAVAHKYGKRTNNLVKSQAWPLIDDSNVSKKIWAFLEKRSHRLTEKLDEMDADSDDEVLNKTSLQSFGGVSIAKQILCRRGQKRFRDALIERYGGRCMISGCELLDVIEAVHIVPFRKEKKHKISNGILLRSDLHTLFDLNLIGINPETLEIFLSDKVRRVETYQQFHKRRLIPNGVLDLSKDYLSLKWKQFSEKHGLQ